MIDPAAPSQIRIFAKSMYLFGIGWTIAAIWLWAAGVQQHILRYAEVPPYFALRTFAVVMSPMPLIALCGYVIHRWSGCAPSPALDRREWIAGFWWALCPNGLAFMTVYVMIRDLR